MSQEIRGQIALIKLNNTPNENTTEDSFETEFQVRKLNKLDHTKERIGIL